MQTQVIQQLCKRHYTLLGKRPTQDTITKLLHSLIHSWIINDPILVPLLRKNEPKLWQDAIRTTEHTIEIFGEVLRNEQTTAIAAINTLNERLIHALHTATKEFYYYILRQERATKIATAEAEGYTLMDEGLIAMTFNGNDYILQYLPCIIDIDDNENAQWNKDNIMMMQSAIGTINDSSLSLALDKILDRLKL